MSHIDPTKLKEQRRRLDAGGQLLKSEMWEQTEERESGWENDSSVAVIRVLMLLNKSQLNWYDKILEKMKAW